MSTPVPRPTRRRLPALISDRRFLGGTAATVVLSLAGAAVVYLAWLALYLSIFGRAAGGSRGIVWWLAPAATALGFAAGMVAADRWLRRRPAAFWKAFLWPVVGCYVGAAAVYSFGPMLIVFGMFVLGAFAVVVREVVRGLPGRTQRAAADAARQSEGADAVR